MHDFYGRNVTCLREAQNICQPFLDLDFSYQVTITDLIETFAYSITMNGKATSTSVTPLTRSFRVHYLIFSPRHGSHVSLAAKTGEFIR